MALTIAGPSCPLTFKWCRGCERWFVLQPQHSSYFCGIECQARFEFERKRLQLCIFPPCLQNVPMAANHLMRRYCSDACCAQAFLDRRGAGAVTFGERTERRKPGPKPQESDPVRSRIQMIERGRKQKWEPARGPAAVCAPKIDLPAQPRVVMPLLPRVNHYVPGSIAFALLYGQQAVGKVDAHSPVSEVRRTGGSGWVGARNHDGVA